MSSFAWGKNVLWTFLAFLWPSTPHPRSLRVQFRPSRAPCHHPENSGGLGRRVERWGEEGGGEEVATPWFFGEYACFFLDLAGFVAWGLAWATEGLVSAFLGVNLMNSVGVLARQRQDRFACAPTSARPSSQSIPLRLAETQPAQIPFFRPSAFGGACRARPRARHVWGDIRSYQSVNQRVWQHRRSPVLVSGLCAATFQPLVPFLSRRTVSPFGGAVQATFAGVPYEHAGHWGRHSPVSTTRKSAPA